jgi:hypothetical protein
MRAIPPTRGGHYTIRTEPVAALSAVLLCNEFPDEIAEREIGGSTPVAPLLDVGLARGLDVKRWWLAWGERWSSGKGGMLKFDASNVTIFWDDTESERVQMFRAEWAGVKRTVTSMQFDAPLSSRVVQWKAPV